MPRHLRAGEARGPQGLDWASGSSACRSSTSCSIVTPITKYAVTVMDPASIAYELDKALHLARTAAGPVWLDIPLDVQGAQVEPAELPSLSTRATEAPAPGRDDGMSAADRADDRAAQRSGAAGPARRQRRAACRSAAGDLLRLVDVLDIPVLTTWMAADLLWEAHPRYFGKPGTVASRGANYTLQNADLLISIGARLDVAGHRVRSDAVRARGQASRRRHRPGGDREARLASSTSRCAPTPLAFIAGAARAVRVVDTRRPSGLASSAAPNGRSSYPVVLPEYWEPRTTSTPTPSRACSPTSSTSDDLIIPGSSGVGIDTFWLSFAVEGGSATVQHGRPGGDGVRPPGEHRRLPRQRRQADDQRRRRRRLSAEHPGAGDGRAARAADQVLRAQQRGLRLDPGDAEQLLPRASRGLRRHRAD